MSRRAMHRTRGADPSPPNASRTNGRAPVVRLLDAIDRARLTPIDVLVLLHAGDAEGTVGDLAERLDRARAEVRRTIGRLVARGLLRPRADHAGPWGLRFAATASGLDLLAGLEGPSTLAGHPDAGRRPPRRDTRRRPLRAARDAPG